jgi:hypothetical protein
MRKPKKKKLSLRRIDRKLDVTQLWTEYVVVSSCEILSKKFVAERDVELSVISIELVISV